MAVGLMLRFLELELVLVVDAVALAVDVVILLIGELIMWLGFLDIEKDDNEVENGDSDIVNEQGDNDEAGGWAGWAPTPWWPVTDDPLAAAAPEPAAVLGPGGWGPCLTMDDGPGLPDDLSPPVSPVHFGSCRGASGP